MCRKIKEPTALEILCEEYNTEFQSVAPKSYEDMKTVMINQIQNCNRSLESQKVEALTKLEINHTMNLPSIASLVFSLSAIAITLVSGILNLQNPAHKMTGLIFNIVIYITLVVVVWHTLKKQKQTYKSSAYYKLKLYCIETIEKELKEAQAKQTPLQSTQSAVVQKPKT